MPPPPVGRQGGDRRLGAGGDLQLVLHLGAQGGKPMLFCSLPDMVFYAPIFMVDVRKLVRESEMKALSWSLSIPSNVQLTNYNETNFKGLI